MKKTLNKLLEIRVIRYGLTGGLATFTHVAIAFSMLHFFTPSVFLANVVGFCCAFILSYLMQSLFVFQHALTLKNAQRFFIVQFAALLTAQLISELFRDTNSYLRVLLVVLLLPAITYLIHRFWTYRQDTGSPISK
ncbi:polysaccharide synthesis protein GtrA [Veronia nyctiphanis]|uniref:Polysaccharide synthesis protein GtrA n=1 Tax=Veronia nyctiphanis TaxID=1278244 RepID=A0A4Q0YWT5_9GAMM|nr:GtrA family protein [Veronia nyctiphanis]RXJ73501.1 polysaccharide synthesis protein GtrA [Veronia nyctiphanis]